MLKANYIILKIKTKNQEKKMSKKLLAALLFTAFVIILTPIQIIGVAQSEAYKPEKNEYNFVFIPKLVHPWYETVKVGIEKAIEEFAERGITINYSWDATSTADVLAQTQKLESAAAKNPDGISIAIIDASVTTAIIDDLVANGINVSTFDTDAPESDRLSYCGHERIPDGIRRNRFGRTALVFLKPVPENGTVPKRKGVFAYITYFARI